MKSTLLNAGSALEGVLFSGFLRDLAQVRELDQGESIGPWRICHELGRGGNGVVYLAERADGAFSKQVALKWLRPDRPVPGAKRALERERELLAGLDHPNIARLVDGGQTDDGMLWFAMDYVAGVHIDRHISGRDVAKRIELVRALCRAVHHAHSRGLIHGDIKPSNVVVDDRDRPRLLDFGIARVQGTGGGGSYGLTPDFSSPEQKRGEMLTTASDVWQLGRLLEALLRGQRMPRDIAAVIARATATDPHSRYPSASAMESDLKAWLERRPVAARGGGSGYRAGRFIRRNLAASALSVAALLLAVTGGSWFTWKLAEERNIAQSALYDTEAALTRAESLREFLLDLFRASQLDQPRDRLPTTEEILALGTKRAVNADAVAVVERFEMLLTIGQVYRSYDRFDDAKPLFEMAIDLARGNADLAEKDLARALEQTAVVEMFGGGSTERAEALLSEAESLVSSKNGSWEVFAEIRVARAVIEQHRGNQDAALQLLVPLADHLYQYNDTNPNIRGRVFDRLASLYNESGDLEQAARFRSDATAAFEQAQGPMGRNYVISLANSVIVERNIGRFDSAVARAHQAIDLYDQIFPDPVDFRANVRFSLAGTYFFMGRFDEALATLDASTQEWTAYLGEDPDTWPAHFISRGEILLGMGRLEDAHQDFSDLVDLVIQQGRSGEYIGSAAQMWLAETSCRLGDWASGSAALEQLESSGGDQVLLRYPRHKAQLFQARATCFFEAGRLEDAKEAMVTALESNNIPGRITEFTTRNILLARILAALGERDRAVAAIHDAEVRFEELELSKHPYLTRIEDARNALFWRGGLVVEGK